MEPAIATGKDIRLAIKALSDMGYRNVVFVANRLYELRQGKLKSSEIPKEVRKPSSPAYYKGSQWFGERLETGEVKPISLRHVSYALSGLKGLTVVEIKNERGERMMEPTVATETDIGRMIKALSDMGFKNVVLVANRLYEMRQGKLASFEIPPAINKVSYPVFHNVLPVEKKKTYGAKGATDGCVDCHGDTAAFFTKMTVLNTGRFLKENYPVPKEPNAEPQMYEWGIRSVPPYE
jgi:hypothetical protein